MNRTDNVQRVFTGEIPRLITMTSNLIMNIGHLARAKIDQKSWWTESCKRQKDGRDDLLPKKQMMIVFSEKGVTFEYEHMFFLHSGWRSMRQMTVMVFLGCVLRWGSSDVHADVVSQILQDLKHRLEAVHL